jgi:short subunit dehydrogenase-like uncharacterized protein
MTDAASTCENCWLLYGAYGYTGRLVAEEAADRKLNVILAGRSREKLEPLASQHQLPWRAFDLDDPQELAMHISGCRAVLNCAGPFAQTAAPMIQACLNAGAHYLDITGEIDCIEAAAALDGQAKAAGVSLIPAVGFDVVPSDCLAAMLAAKLPGATHLQLAIDVTADLSPGTAKTMLQTAPRGGRVRVEGEIRRVPVAWKMQRIDFAGGPRWAVTIPWGDVATAYHSTGIPNIEVYASAKRWQVWLGRLARPLIPLVRTQFIQSRWRRTIERKVRGPSKKSRRTRRASLWGRAWNAHTSEEVEATLTTPEAYALTALTALASLERVLATPPTPGFCTPSLAFGQNFILEFPRVDLTWKSV